MLIDSHAHLGDDSLYSEIDLLLERARLAGVESIVNICTDELTLQRGREIRSRHPRVYNAAATPPHDALREGERLFSLMAEAAEKGELVAVGETGLDYFWHRESREAQKRLFSRYLQLARSCALPVVIHCRDAFEDFFELIDREYPGGPGVLHCFTGGIEEARQLIERGWHLSFSGIATFKKSVELREAAKLVPLERLLIETDSPYLAPQSRRGKRNEPAFLTETAQSLAEAKGLTLEQLARATAENARALFSLS